jgi:hypothetical protein
MVSHLKSETARANGAKSRGPTTDEGKEKSSRNSLKHGLTAGNGNILLDCEDRAQFDEVQSKLLGIHEPATPAEKDVVEEMVAARWRTRRMWTIETNLLNVEILIHNPSVSEGDPGIHLAMAFRTLSDDSRSLALASRYEARLQRVYDRAYKTLRELQQARKSEPPQEPPTIRIKWVKPETEPDQPAAGAHPPGSTAPSVSEGEFPADNPSVSEGESSAPGQPATEPELPNEPTDITSKEVSAQTEPRASASGLRGAQRDQPLEAQAFVPLFRPAGQHPTSDIQNPSSKTQNLKSDTPNPSPKGL